jgi:excisionase family DNA binding protein
VVAFPPADPAEGAARVSERLLTADEVADLLGVPTRWVREHTRSGAIPHVQLGRYVRYDYDDVLAWVESLKAGGGPAFRRHRPQAVS